ncbi:MAG: hypothetical protein GXY61_14775 [Lentisphaerae bacterium]|nr:hypothetical protein [Lentisphaerota bacterium]
MKANSRRGFFDFLNGTDGFHDQGGAWARGMMASDGDVGFYEHGTSDEADRFPDLCPYRSRLGCLCRRAIIFGQYRRRYVGGVDWRVARGASASRPH